MKIVFLHNSRTLDHVEIREYCQNPGIGGTEFVTIQIITKLCKKFRNFIFTFGTERLVKVNRDTTHINIINYKTFIENSIIICPMSQINYLKKYNYRKCRVILWSHHPHDVKLWPIDCDEIISLGEYQYYSNSRLSSKHYLIRNPAPKPIDSFYLERFNLTSPENFVYVGAIGPAKGLHLILKKWPEYKKYFPNSKLNVIGGDLYRESSANINGDIPISGKYRNLLQEIINKMPEDYQHSICFHGLLSDKQKDHILRSCDVALLNPTGKSEAAPASPLECYTYGIPVISGGDFGAFDNMQHFPELDLTRNNLSEILNVLSNTKKYLELKRRAYTLAHSNYDQNNSILEKWVRLFENKLCTSRVYLPKYIKFKITIRNFYYIFLKYPLRKLIKLIK